MSSTVPGIQGPRSAGNPQCRGPFSQMEAPSSCSYSSQATGAASPRSHICPSCASIWPLLACLCCCVGEVGGRLSNSGGLRRKPKFQGGSPQPSFCLRELGWGIAIGSEEISEGWNQGWDPDCGSAPLSLAAASPDLRKLQYLLLCPVRGHLPNCPESTRSLLGTPLVGRGHSPILSSWSAQGSCRASHSTPTQLWGSLPWEDASKCQRHAECLCLCVWT